jgi:hypothetical protein
MLGMSMQRVACRGDNQYLYCILFEAHRNEKAIQGEKLRQLWTGQAATTYLKAFVTAAISAITMRNLTEGLAGKAKGEAGIPPERGISKPSEGQHARIISAMLPADDIT